MSRSFGIAELVRIAVVDERSGAALYRAMAEKTGNAELKEQFQELAEQERRHEKRFQELLATVESEPPAQYPDEYLDYIEMRMAEGGAGASHTTLEGTDSDLELIETALRFEREQLALQRDMGDYLGDRHKPVVEEIVQEEKDHLVTLSRMKKNLR
jgi:rubrerythrin